MLDVPRCACRPSLFSLVVCCIACTSAVFFVFFCSSSAQWGATRYSWAKVYWLHSSPASATHGVAPLAVAATRGEHPACGHWDLNMLLLLRNTSRTTIEWRVDRAANTAVVAWSHERSGAPAASGTVRATVTHCLPSSSSSSVSLSGAGGSCVGANSSKVGVWNGRTKGTRQSRTEREDQMRRDAVVVDVSRQPWEDLLPLGDQGANLWHFHAAAFRLWLALRLATAVSTAISSFPSSSPSVDSLANRTLLRTHDLDDREKRPVVLLLPVTAWGRAIMPTNGTLLLTDAALRAAARGHWLVAPPARSALEGLQGVSDALGGRVVAVLEGLSEKKMRDALALLAPGEKDGVRISAWVEPPRDGFLWDLAHDPHLARKLRGSQCGASAAGSALAAYARAMLTFRHHSDDKPDDGVVRKERGGTVNTDTDPVARHVCLVSRQARGRGADESRGKLRNLEAGMWRGLILRLGAAVVLSPSSGLRDTDRFPLLLMNRASVSTQLAFVRAECAVLVGVHGAGMTNALGLRPGTTVVELLPRGKKYRYFANVAALLPHVAYETVTVHPLDNDAGKDEVDLRLSSADTDKLVQLLNNHVAQSVRMQRALDANGSINASE